MRLSFPSSFSLRRPPGLAAWHLNPNLALRGVIGLAALLLCWQVSGLLSQLLGWQSTQPALVLPTPPATDTGAARAALSRWFISAEGTQAAANPTAGLQLIAVVTGKRGVALLSGIGSSPVAVGVGKDARPGQRLVEVLADRVVFEQAGVRSELAFPKAPSDLITPANKTPAAAVPPPVIADSEPLPTQSASISRGQMAGVAQGGNLGDWDKGLANFAGGGIRVAVASEQPLAKVLNLRDGDILKRVNDRELKQLADISLIYHYFSQAQEVNLTVLRDGKQQQLNFKIQP